MESVMAQPEPEDDDIKRAPLTPEERAELRRQARALAESPDEEDVMNLLESLADWSDVPPWDEQR